MASASGLAAFVGKVGKRRDIWKAVQISVTKMTFNDYLKMYFNKPETYWAADPDKKVKEGDIVLIRELEEPQSDVVQHYVHDIVFESGNIIDPITGRKCRGTKFVDERFRNFPKFELKNTFAEEEISPIPPYVKK
ncbi:DgyrCDS3815 [Dimorphilus gyrociliatus]|uniref:DgyrCDS3815 n=1 Tax=Dimorphilus gyrociliatus TaxID=2664684 RepID=A0A7I8VH73_9ANNE|nr:DgyrCDS3815 [Dimorphilus gyrociliatus]